MGFHFGTIVAAAIACASLSAPYTGVNAAPGQNLRQLQASQSIGEHLGCYNDRKNDDNRVFDMKTVLEDDNSPFNCAQICAAEGLPLMGLQNGVQCWCGPDDTDYDRYGKAEDCDDPCPGASNLVCGQHLKSDTYRLELVNDEGPSDVSYT